MGWLFNYSWETKEDLIAHLEINFSACKLIERTKNGKWWLFETTHHKTGELIHVALRILMEYHREDRCYGYKYIDLESGPYDVSDFPRRWLKDPLLQAGNPERYPAWNDFISRLKLPAGERMKKKNRDVVAISFL